MEELGTGPDSERWNWVERQDGAAFFSNQLAELDLERSHPLDPTMEGDEEDVFCSTEICYVSA